MISSTEALRLKQSLEIHHHLSSLDLDDAEREQMNPEEAISCLRSCVQAVLGKPRVEVAVQFAKFRKQLDEQTFKSDDEQVRSLEGSPYFFQRTAISILLASLRTADGARLEHAIGNVGILLPVLWSRLRKPERWSVGQTYASIVADGRKVAAIGLKRALVAVNGFDFVPENLRSTTFTAAARDVLAAHEGFDNYHNETRPMRALASLGTSIPMPAFANCMTATLAIYIGNPYGFSWAAQSAAESVLKSLTPAQWRYYLEECLPSDRLILDKLVLYEKPRARWIELTKSFKLTAVPLESERASRLIAAGAKAQNEEIGRLARQVLGASGYQRK